MRSRPRPTIGMTTLLAMACRSLLHCLESSLIANRGHCRPSGAYREQKKLQPLRHPRACKWRCSLSNPCAEGFHSGSRKCLGPHRCPKSMFLSGERPESRERTTRSLRPLVALDQSVQHPQYEERHSRRRIIGEMMWAASPEWTKALAVGPPAQAQRAMRRQKQPRLSISPPNVLDAPASNEKEISHGRVSWQTP